MTEASGTFEIDEWTQDDPYEQVGTTSLGRIHLSKTFHGDLTGTGTVELLAVGTAAGPASYVALELVQGTLLGRKGSFVLRHEAEGGEGEPWMRWVIVRTSGTGELEGIRGEGQIVRADDGTHTWTLDYELGGPG